MEPVISLFGPGIRTQYWMRLYESLLPNEVPFDLTLVGNKEPDFELPTNFHFIYSPVKPAQCVEIGSRNVTGEYIIPGIPDDVVLSPGALDSLYDLFTRIKWDRLFISMRYVLDGNDISEQCSWYNVWFPTPLMPVCPIMKRGVWRQLGGVDRRFIALYWDLDLAMRLYEIGGSGLLSPDAKIEELKQHEESLLFEKYAMPHDRPLLDSFWMQDGKVVRNRLSPFEPIMDKDILTISQGNKGEWP